MVLGSLFMNLSISGSRCQEFGRSHVGEAMIGDEICCSKTR